MAKLGTVQAKWRKDYTDSDGREAYTEYALRADGTAVKKIGWKAEDRYADQGYEWRDTGWHLANKRKGYTIVGVDELLAGKGYARQ